MNQESRIKKFTDLIAWQKGHGLVLEIYRTVDCFPKKEEFGLSSQIRRAVFLGILIGVILSMIAFYLIPYIITTYAK